MNPLERVALYATAIQTGLRSAELRSLTKADLFLAGEKPYVRCKAENTKNSQEARQYIQRDLADELRRIVTAKAPTANVFAMPDEWSVAAVLRGDLGEARRAWLDEMKHDTEARAKREETDFLTVKNHQGESLDFHSLRHTTGAWLALERVHPNVIKTVMRHSSITLTMDTYGHLLPDQHADVVFGMAPMFERSPLRTAVGAAIGVRRDGPGDANQCEQMPNAPTKSGTDAERKPLRIADVCETVRDDASTRATGPTWIRTKNQGIMSPLL